MVTVVVAEPVELPDPVADANAPVWYDRMVTFLFAALGLVGVLFAAVTRTSIKTAGDTMPISTAIQLMVLVANLSPGRKDNDQVTKLLRDWGYTVQQNERGNVEVVTPSG